jgi:hypothetical protein
MSFPDLDSLNSLAAYVGDWKAIAVGAVAILSSVGTLLKYGFAPFRWIWRKMPGVSGKQKQEHVPKNALRFVQNEQRSFWGAGSSWGPGTSGKETGTHVCGHFHVTNIVKDWNFVLLQAKLAGYDHKHSVVATAGFRNRPYPALTPIPAGNMAQVNVNLFFYPAITKDTEPLIAEVIFTDNYGEEYRVPSTFRYVNG